MEPQPRPGSPNRFNERVGANLQRIRKRAGLSQADLARELTDKHGLPFQQQTVLKVEKGARPLRLEEADAIATILEIAVSNLLDNSLDVVGARALTQLVHARANLAAAARTVTEARTNLEEAEEAYRVAKVHADIAAQEFELVSSERAQAADSPPGPDQSLADEGTG